jgi:hypothetical protein
MILLLSNCLKQKKCPYEKGLKCYLYKCDQFKGLRPLQEIMGV